MATTFRIPKLTDREIAAALGRIRDELHSQIQLQVRIQVPTGNDVEIPDKKPDQHKALKYVFDYESQLSDRFQLVAPDGNPALQVVRKPEDVLDSATIPDDWLRRRGQEYEEK